MQLLALQETLTRADHQTHRRFAFDVPADCEALELWVRYAPKFLSREASLALARAALEAQRGALARRVGEAMAEQWAANLAPQAGTARISNLVTLSLDDAGGAYRGAAHRQSPDQRLRLGIDAASPGLVRGPLPAGTWQLTLSAHTLVSNQCDVSIQIGAESASSR